MSKQKERAMGDRQQLVATTYAGLEEVLAQELIALNADEVEAARRAVYFSGDAAMIYRANYALRTALRVLVPVRTFKIYKAEDLYFQASKIHWEEYFGTDKTFVVQETVFSDLFRNSMYASLKLKDAIVDRFRRMTGKRPSVDLNRPDVVVNLHLANNSCTVSLDSSGESLHKRGYRIQNHEAPISEVLAAGLLRLSGWSAGEPLLDPMCGSGTIVIEAAMMACDIAPGACGRSYAFQNWKSYQPDLFEKIKKEVVRKKIGFQLYGSDISRSNINKAYKNVEKAGVSDVVCLEVADFRSLEKRAGTSFLLFNPPYGERIKSGDETLYTMIGDVLKNNFPDCEAWIISTASCFKSIGLRPAKKIPVYNGALECSFRKFELYQGSKKR